MTTLAYCRMLLSGLATVEPLSDMPGDVRIIPYSSDYAPCEFTNPTPKHAVTFCRWLKREIRNEQSATI